MVFVLQTAYILIGCVMQVRRTKQHAVTHVTTSVTCHAA